MDNSQKRSIDLSRAAHGTSAPRARSAYDQEAQAAQRRPQEPHTPPHRAAARPQHAADSRRRAPRQSTAPQTAKRRPQSARRKKKKTGRRALVALLCVCAVVGLCAIGLNAFVGSLLNEGSVGSVTKKIKTPPQLSQQQMSLLVVGIDYTTSDADVVQRDPIGQTDMLLYLRFNFVDNTLRMLQIPRDLFMGAELSTGGTGKINALYKNGEQQDKNRIDNLAVPLSETLQLPIDGYVSIDMESLREIVDVFGGVEVYITSPHDYKGSHLDAGWQNLTGDNLEFFLRDRHNTPTSDIGRLDNQRYFYSALFRRLRTATWQDIVKLMPVAQKYSNTDLSPMDCAALGIRMLKIPSSNIMMARLPNFDSTENYNGKYEVQVADVPDIADLLNEYFRTPETQVPAEQYTFTDWPHAATPHTANVQWMQDIDADGGGTVGEAADATTTGDDLLAPPSSAPAPAA
ncbi:MAG: LCP family protein [Ruthenibacterium sp.]